jgi:hypothetical protein
MYLRFYMRFFLNVISFHPKHFENTRRRCIPLTGVRHGRSSLCCQRLGTAVLNWWGNPYLSNQSFRYLCIKNQTNWNSQHVLTPKWSKILNVGILFFCIKQESNKLKLLACFNTKVVENLKCRDLVLLHHFSVCCMYFEKSRTGTVHKTDMNTDQFVPVSHMFWPYRTIGRETV